MMLWNMNRHPARLGGLLLVVALLLVPQAASASSDSDSDPKFSAQRRPRVTVMPFKDTNTVATNENYGDSVSAMLVTYLKAQSQFVLVERQNLEAVLEEWQRNQDGQTNLNLDPEQSELLEKIDVILMGEVTVLDASGRRGTSAMNNAEGFSDATIEIDAKLLSRSDGRVLAAVERSGPIQCLRQITNRVGIGIEKSYLRRYSGSMELTFPSPTNTHISLTPILMDNALDEEKMPRPLHWTAKMGKNQDKNEPWVTNPNSYSIEGVLSGWYLLHLTRPGFSSPELDDNLYQAFTVGNRTLVRYLGIGANSFKRVDVKRAEAYEAGRGAPWLKHIVYIRPLESVSLDAQKRGFGLPIRNGSLQLEIEDENSESLKGYRAALRSLDLEINPSSPDQPISHTTGKEVNSPQEGEQPKNFESTLFGMMEEAEQEVCKYLIDDEFPSVDYGDHLIKSGDSFDLFNFEGGSVRFENYRGEAIPAGRYELALWAPNYDIKRLEVEIGAFEEPQHITVRLQRKVRKIQIHGRSSEHVLFKGRLTGHQQRLRLARGSGTVDLSLPADTYDIEADIIGVNPWINGLDLASGDEVPSIEMMFGEGETVVPVDVRVKDRVWVGGRYQRFRPAPNAFYLDRVHQLLDQLLGDPEHYDWNFELVDNQTEALVRLKEELQYVDLLILNEHDMMLLPIFPDLAKMIHDFIERGHAVMAFIASPGDYGEVFGAPFVSKETWFGSSKMKLRPRDGKGLSREYKVDLGTSRRRFVPRKKKTDYDEWRVFSSEKQTRKHRVIEKGGTNLGGYTLVWLESAHLRTDPWDFNGTKETVAVGAGEGEVEGATMPKVKVNLKALIKARNANQDILMAKTEIKAHALLWAEYLMLRRLGEDPATSQELKRKILQSSQP